ncbi:MAG: tyrosine-type recombinase/integrase [Syntrophales bacterium]|jgi:integrase|nr:tyrosine-type recombinase/integrase [Syntrophales bacterium]
MGLTDLQIKKLKPMEKRYEVTDAKGLSIRIKPTGGKSWFFRYMFEGAPRIMTLGEYPGIPLEEARKRHNQAIMDVQQGIDPGKKAIEAKAKRKAAPTVQDLLDEFWEEELGKTPSGNERKRLVDKDAIPTWKKRKVSSITRRDAVLLLDKVRKRAPITANRLQGVLIRMFNFASERGIIDFSPLAGMRRGKENSRSRVLTDAEIKALWNCLELEQTDIDIYRLTKLALKAILLTGQRPGEVAGMSWNEIEGDWWIIPADRSKTREENRVPITPMLAEIIEQARPYSTGSRFVFVSPRSPLYQHKKPDIAKPKESDIPISVGTMANAIRRHSAEMGINERFTPHDLRRTLRTRLAEIGISDIVAERVLGHKLQGVLGIYNRHSYDAEKRQALALWERRLSEILGLSESVSNVIQLNEVRHG